MQVISSISSISTFLLVGIFLCSSTANAAIVERENTFKARATSPNFGTLFSGVSTQAQVAGFSDATSSSDHLAALGAHAALAMQEIFTAIPDAANRPSMVAALIMNVDDPNEKVYVYSSLRGVGGTEYTISPPLHPALVSVFRRCVETLPAKDGLSDPGPVPNKVTNEEGDTVILTKAQKKELLDERNEILTEIKKYANHGNNGRCAEIMAMNRWLRVKDPQNTMKSLSQLQALLTSDTYKGKKRVITVNIVRQEVQVADPCSKGKDAMWGCKETLELMGFDATCEVGLRANLVQVGTVSKMRRAKRSVDGGARLDRRTREKKTKGKKATTGNAATTEKKTQSTKGKLTFVVGSLAKKDKCRWKRTPLAKGTAPKAKAKDASQAKPKDASKGTKAKEQKVVKE